jgi:hypothetical protein
MSIELENKLTEDENTEETVDSPTVNDEETTAEGNQDSDETSTEYSTTDDTDPDVENNDSSKEEKNDDLLVDKLKNNDYGELSNDIDDIIQGKLRQQINIKKQEYIDSINGIEKDSETEPNDDANKEDETPGDE